MILLVEYFALAYSTPLTCTCHERKKKCIDFNRVALFPWLLYVIVTLYHIIPTTSLAKGQK